MQTPFDRYEHLPSDPFWLLFLLLPLLPLHCFCTFNKQFLLWIETKDITSYKKQGLIERKRDSSRHKSVLILIGFGFNLVKWMANEQNLPVFRDLNLNWKYFQMSKLTVPCIKMQNHIIYESKMSTHQIDKISVVLLICGSFAFLFQQLKYRSTRRVH